MPAAEPCPLTVATWLRFMIGQRSAILSIAAAPSAVWLGLLFVLSAGLAREYDGEYLLREPWHLLLPLGASLATSLVLYTMVFTAAISHGVKDLRWWGGYRTFLSFYWMTAPLAWLYAVPVERMLEPGAATTANLLLLAIVSLWRVALTMRVVCVWLAAGVWTVLFIVLFFATSVVIVATWITPTPIWDIMGGVRLPESESIILNVKMTVWVFGGAAWWILLIPTAILIVKSKPEWYINRMDGGVKTGRSLWTFAGLLLIGGCALLPITQPEQQRRWHAERLLRSGQVSEAVQYMAQFDRDAFPPHWDPPPRLSYGEREPALEDVLSAVDAADAPEWLRDIYLGKIDLSTTWLRLHDAIEAAERGEPHRLEGLLGLLERQGPAGQSEHVRWVLHQASDNEKIEPSLRQRVRDYLSTEVEAPPLTY